MNLIFYNDPSDKKMGYCDGKVIYVNDFHHNSDKEVFVTIVHEMTHMMLHFNRKHYTPIEKEYQATMVEYNYARTNSSKRAFLHYKTLLKGDNFNLSPLQNEVKDNYKKIVLASLKLYKEVKK